MGHHVRKRIEHVISPAPAVQGVDPSTTPDAERRRVGKLAVGLILMAALTAWLPVRRVVAEAFPSGGDSGPGAAARPFAGRARRHVRRAYGLNGKAWGDTAFIEPARPLRISGRRMRSPRPVAHSGISITTPDSLRRGLDRSH